MTPRGSKPFSYAPHGHHWGVWSADGYHYDDYLTKEEARKVVYELNGWTLKS